jgi:hypothetical protein
MNLDTAYMLDRLMKLGITYDDSVKLRRISMQLHRWHEYECGVEHGGVERDETTGQCYWYNSNTVNSQSATGRGLMVTSANKGAPSQCQH